MRVRLRSAGHDDATPHEVDVFEDDTLMDVCDASVAPLLFSCRSGECGICALVVLSGADLVESATEREVETLALRVPGADARTRLGCRVRLRASGSDPKSILDVALLRG